MRITTLRIMLVLALVLGAVFAGAAPAAALSTGCAALNGFSTTIPGGAPANFGPYDLLEGEVVVLTLDNVVAIPAPPTPPTAQIVVSANGTPVAGGNFSVFPGVVTVTIPLDVSLTFTVVGAFVSADISVTCGTTASAGGDTPVPSDNRFNFGLGDTDVVMFPADGVPGIVFYGVDDAGNGTFVFSITEDDIAPWRDNAPAENTLIKQSPDGYYQLWVLTTGEFQLMVGPDDEGKTLVIIFTGLTPSNIYGYVLE